MAKWGCRGWTRRRGWSLGGDAASSAGVCGKVGVQGMDVLETGLEFGWGCHSRRRSGASVAGTVALPHHQAPRSLGGPLPGAQRQCGFGAHGWHCTEHQDVWVTLRRGHTCTPTYTSGLGYMDQCMYASGRCMHADLLVAVVGNARETVCARNARGALRCTQSKLARHPGARCAYHCTGC